METKKISHFNSLTKGKKILTIINYSLCIVFFFILLCFVIIMLILGDPTNRLVTCIATGICYLLPFIIQWIFKTRLSPCLILLYVIFLTLSGFMGSCLFLYHYIPKTDKIMHFSWGYLSGFIGLYLLCRTKEIDSLKKITVVIIIFGISMATASIWEIIEYLSDILLGQHAQGKAVNGIIPITDTMLDMLVHFIGSIIFSLQYILEANTKVNFGIKSIINDFKIDY